MKTTLTIEAVENGYVLMSRNEANGISYTYVFKTHDELMAQISSLLDLFKRKP